MAKYIDADDLKNAFLIEGKDVCDGTDEFDTRWGASQELIEKVIDSAPAADVEPKQRWISTRESLPDEKTPVLICYCKYSKHDCGILCKRNIAISRRTDFNFWSGLGREIDVTHWMPIPKFPKGEEDA